MCITPEQVKKFHIGSVLSGGGSCPGDNTTKDWVNMNDAYWAASVESDEDHLAIPIIYGVDAIHGHNNVLGATIFPHNIGLGAANDPDLIERIAQITAREILATGVEWTFAPTLAVAQDLQWGRTYESYSERPDIVTSYAGKFIRGMQGNLGQDSVIACVKHWVGDGGTTYGIDQGDTRISEEELYKTHIAPYLPALKEGSLTVMASFNSWNGDKCHGHHYLLTEVLKNRLGFKGFIISDWDGIDYLSESYYEAVGKGINAGIDMFMVSEKWEPFIQHTRTHVEQGTISMERIDDAVSRILYVKLKYGLFEKARPSERYWSNHPSFGSAAHREVAREAVRKSLVLLKNEENTLPLNKDANILVAGKNADDCGHQCGGFTIAWQGVSDNSSVAQASTSEIFSPYAYQNTNVQKGTIVGGTSIWEGIKKVATNATLDLNADNLKANNYDAAIVIIGETPYAEGMGDIRDGDDRIVEMGSYIKGLMKVLHPYGHSLVNKDLHPEDVELINRISDAGIPIIVVFVSGRPLLLDEEIERASAFVAAWLPGSEGDGVADVLFGDYGFQGMLSFSWPKLGGNSEEMLYPYGFGLKYSEI
jgi:beta-glucosidase